MIGIIGAMPVEVEGLIRLIEGDQTRRISGLDFHRGRLAGREVVVVRGGVGKVNAAMCAQTMILTYRPALIVNVGVAGCFTDRLNVGDIAVARDLVQYDVDTSALGDPVGLVSTVNRVAFPCDESASQALLEAARGLGFNAASTRIASGDRFVNDEPTARLIVDTFSAEVSEMEGCPIAQVCYVNSVPFAALRSISDCGSGQHGGEYGLYRDLAAEHSARALLAFLEGPYRE